MSTRLALIFGGFALAGVLQLVLARWLARRTRALLARGKRASGRRVGSATSTGVDGGGSRHDVVEFTSEDGQRREVTSRIGVPWSTDKEREITVLYDPADPGHAVIDTWVELWAGPAIFYTNGGLMTLAAAICAALTLAGVLPDDP